MTRSYTKHIVYNDENHHPNRKHGMFGTPEHYAWSNMLARCYRTKDPSYFKYGAVGITVCDAWRSPDTGFQAFFDEIGKRPGKGYTVDRIDNAKGYEPGNVRWATKYEQTRNRTCTRFMTAFGKTQTQMEWSKETGIKYSTISQRLKLGWSEERALGQTTRYKKPHKR